MGGQIHTADRDGAMSRSIGANLLLADGHGETRNVRWILGRALHCSAPASMHSWRPPDAPPNSLYSNLKLLAVLLSYAFGIVQGPSVTVAFLAFKHIPFVCSRLYST